MNCYLLDANVLIAMTNKSHPHFERVRRWFPPDAEFAVCPITQGALVRFLVQAGQEASFAQGVVHAISKRAGYHFWKDDVPYEDADLSLVIGHKQVTDAYLVSLTRAHGGARIATLDEGMVALYPNDTVLIPQ